MGFDSADLASLEASGNLVDVILHEMGHVLGIGTVWAGLGLVSGTGFNGAAAVAAYQDIFSTSATLVPIEQEGGAGTAGGHWDEDVFDNELMTGFIEPGGNPLSVITVGAFDDMGYTVDYAAADAYAPPAAVAPAGAQAAGAAAAIRRLPARISFPDRPSVILNDDDAARELVRTALDDALSTDTPHGPLDLRHLADEQWAVLAAWASVGREAASLAAGWSSTGPSSIVSSWAAATPAGSGIASSRLFALVGMG